MDEEKIACSESDLEELYKFINNPMSGRGIHTWPHGDENNQRIYAACVELERRGKLHREIDEPEHVFWSPSE